MNKKGSAALWISLILLGLLVITLFLYFVLYNPAHNSSRVDKISSGELVNPTTGLSVESAVKQFNESFVYYLLYNIKAYNLHNPPLSKNTPKILIYVDNDVYNAEVDRDEIYVVKDEIVSKDIIIRTTKEEAVKMIRDKNYIADSFSSGNSKIELITDKSTLFGKGYLNLYKELTGNGITGSVVKIYSG